MVWHQRYTRSLEDSLDFLASNNMLSFYVISKFENMPLQMTCRWFTIKKGLSSTIFDLKEFHLHFISLSSRKCLANITNKALQAPFLNLKLKPTLSLKQHKILKIQSILPSH